MEIFSYILVVLISLIALGIGILVGVALPMLVIKKTAKLRGLPKPSGWMVGCLLIGWLSPLIYYFFVAQKHEKIFSSKKRNILKEEHIELMTKEPSSTQEKKIFNPESSALLSFFSFMAIYAVIIVIIMTALYFLKMI